MNGFGEGIITIGTLILGIAALSVLVSPKATTSQVIQASASGFVNALATAQSPVTGNPVNIVSAYPGNSGMSMNLGAPNLSYGAVM
jgi:hypothetical protein